MKFTSAANTDLNFFSIFLHYLTRFSRYSSKRAWGTHNVHSFHTDNCSETIRCKVDFGMCSSFSNCLYVILLFIVIAFRTASTDFEVAISDGRPVCSLFSRTKLPRPAFYSPGGRIILIKHFRHFFETLFFT